jgi:diguanylate cyclase (GGDEF)-like protein/PAS domain S-box-containing protein
VKHYRSHILVAFVLAIVVSVGLRPAIRNMLTDLRFGSTPRAASGDIVVVAIDSRSILGIGVWPWPRTLHAELIDRLRAAGVNDIVFDVDFSTPSSPAADAAFAAALKSAGGSIILPAFRQPSNAKDGAFGALHVNRPLPAFQDQSWSAIVNVAVERDGRVRRYPVGDLVDGQLMPSMAAVMAGQSDLSQPPFLIDFGIRAASVPVVSYVDVLQGQAEALQAVRGKKVIIGGTALELGDRFSVPNGTVISGPLLQVLAAESMMQGRALYFSSGTVTLAGLTAILLIMTLAWRRMSAGYRVGLLAGMAAAIEAGAWVVQSEYPFVLDTSLFLFAIGAYLAAIALDEIDFRGLLAKVAEKRFQRVTMVLGDGVMCADSNLSITMWNPGAEAIFGYAAREVIGRSVDMLFATASEGKPTVSSRILASPQSTIRAAGGWVIEIDGRRKNGEIFSLEACLSEWDGTDGVNYGASLRDISERKREAEKVRYLAEHDTVTGLLNRYTLQTRLGESIALASLPRPISLLAICVDKFEQTNVMLGHAFGDELLHAVAERLSGAVGQGVLIARLGGDQFAVLAENTDGARAAELAAYCAAAFERPLHVSNRAQQVAVRVGVAVLPVDGTTAEEALGNAQLALVQATLSDTVNTVFYEVGFRSEITNRLRTEAELVQALGLHEFELFYQPQVSLADHRIIGAEALIRWRHPERGLVPPMQFMPIVNTSTISNQVAGWVLHTACRQGAAWARAGHGIRIGVNLSPSQFTWGDLPTEVASALAVSGLPPALLELEVTEDILLDDKKAVLSIFRRLRDLGVRMVFDDFGTGYGSLSYLRNFPLDGLKIDRSFVRELRENRSDAAIVASTIELSKRLGLSVIAEGIEDGATAALLKTLGCEEGQGYYFGKPMPVKEFESMFFADENSIACIAISA